MANKVIFPIKKTKVVRAYQLTISRKLFWSVTQIGVNFKLGCIAVVHYGIIVTSSCAKHDVCSTLIEIKMPLIFVVWKVYP